MLGNKKNDMNPELNQEATEVITTTLESNMKKDDEGVSYCDLEVK